MYNEETGMYEGYIYQIYNPFNMKSYIGQTTKTIEQRIDGHKKSAKHNISSSQFLYQDAYDYGWNILNIYQIEKIECITIEELKNKLNDKEIYYIKHYNTLYPNGYNILAGGQNDNVRKQKRVYKFTLYGELIDSYCSMNSASIENNISISSISLCCSEKRLTAGNFCWSIAPVLSEAMIKRLFDKKVVQYSLKGDLICVFNFLDDAVLYIDSFHKSKGIKATVRGNITQCMSGIVNTAYGYIWKRYNDVVDINNSIFKKISVN